jgi:hypothetical protein
LIDGATNPQYSKVTGQIFYGRSNSIWSVPFDDKRLMITGPQSRILEGVYIFSYGAAQFRISEKGTLVYIPGLEHETERSMVFVDRNGKETIFTDIKRQYRRLNVSPDGKYIAFCAGGEDNPDIWLHNLARGTQQPLTSGGYINSKPNWSPDGKYVSFQSNRSGGWNIHLIRADGIGEAKPLFVSDPFQVGGTWSDDGRLFAFFVVQTTSNRDIWVYSTQSDTAVPFLAEEYNEHSPAISPDGKWIAYTSDQTDRNEIWITPYPGPGQKEKVSINGGVGALWSPDGHELFYREGYKMIAVSIQTTPSLNLGIPEVLFENQDYIHIWNIPYYDIHSDGDKFVMVKDEETSLNRINIVINWFEELKEQFRERTK